jgi:hypothetical protein
MILLSILVFTCLSPAQETPKDTLSRKEIKKRQKEEKELLRQKQFEHMSQLLENRTFVLEAEYIQDEWLNRFSVSSVINFVMVNADTLIGQFGAISAAGENGTGGETGKGIITTYKLSKKEKDRSFFLAIGIVMPTRHIDIYIDIDASGAARADVVFYAHNHWIYDGNIVSMKDTKVVVGRYL